MPVVKGGVWTNIEDEILKASVSKYGLNQWARVSSLLARKTPKQCKARWSEWLDPGIRKIEWSKEEDEKLLHLAKLMPTQWRTIAPIVGRTATQCLERYQKLLDEAEQKEAGELGLGGPEGGETKAPSADDVRRLRPGEVDPDPESKPARPDTVDLDEDEKEMLSEARARLANTQGKKAKRKARERQLEESRRLAVLQKRRELKNAGINIKVVNRKKGQMDYNADIPFEKAPAPGFYDTGEEAIQNEKQRAAFDPRKQQLAIKRKGDQDDNPDQKRQKNDKNAPSASYQAAMKAGQMQKIREAEQSSKRRALVLPAPQVGEGELEEIVKMGMIGERANMMARSSENDATRGLVNTYSTVNSGAPIRTPRAPAQEDHIANEIRNIRALTETQSSLLGGDNTPLHEGAGSTGFDGATPRKQQMETPNPMATPFRANGIAATPARNGVGATPMRTPRDSFALNADGEMELVGRTPQDLKLREISMKKQLKAGLASLPKPKDTEWELELPEEQQEALNNQELSEEDAEIRDRRNRQIREAQEQLEFKRRTQVLQKGLPRPSVIDIDALMKTVANISDPVDSAIEREAALLIANDAIKYPTPGAKVRGAAKPIDIFDDEALSQARLQLLMEVPKDLVEEGSDAFREAWNAAHKSSLLPGLSGYDSDDEVDEQQMLIQAFDNIQESIIAAAEKGNKSEKKLALHLGGYQQRAKMLRQKIGEASEALSKAIYSLDAFRTLQISEDVAISRRLEDLRERVSFVSKREREAQELYRERKEELMGLTDEMNGFH
ncbi:Pre-mRNA-splicing factor cef1 [Clarireedia jacksonii]